MEMALTIKNGKMEMRILKSKIANKKYGVERNHLN